MIFWKHVKGMNQGTDTDATQVYSYLEFSDTFQTVDDNDNPSETTPFGNSIPQLKVCDYNKLSETGNEKDYGRIITEKGLNQKIDQVFLFKNQVNFKRIGGNFFTYAMYVDSQTSEETSMWGLWCATDGTYTNLDIHQKFCIHDKKGNAGNGRTVLMIENANASSSTSYTAFNFVYSYINLGGAASHQANGDLSAKNIYSDSLIKAEEKCEALYFNATSDKRSKKDIKPLSINALDLIKRVQLYSFKYKDSDLPSIGILAQDVQDVNIEGFDLVDNKQASGVDMDYMSIHESKLTYILWKAIQEQQKEIEELKTQIKNLTK